MAHEALRQAHLKVRLYGCRVLAGSYGVAGIGEGAAGTVGAVVGLASAGSVGIGGNKRSACGIGQAPYR